MDKEIVKLFLEVLMVCNAERLIGREMFAIDGCKLPSNASKEWSGTRAEFKKKAEKMERAIAAMIARHRETDASPDDQDLATRDKKYVDTLKKRARKVRDWLKDNDDKMGKGGKPIKSNITDNESAKMKTSKGVIQGYDGVTAVDGKHQVIVHAEAHGKAQEHDLLKPMVEGTRDNFKSIGDENVFEDARLTADSGFHTEKNMEMLFTGEIDAYVADTMFRKRDPRFADYDRFKKRHREERARLEGRSGLFKTDDFIFPENLSHCICPAGKRLYRNGENANTKGFLSVRFRGPKSACIPCKLRKQCLQKPDRTECRQVAYFFDRTEKKKNSFTEKMKQKIDSATGRAIYGMRLAIGEPPFANLRHAIGLRRFTLRSKRKVNTQWNLFCIVHNLKKIQRFGQSYA